MSLVGDMAPVAGTEGESSISDELFAAYQRWIHQATGIHLAPAKKTLLCGRLAKRLRILNLGGYREYYELVSSGTDAAEAEICVNLITTNETYFFREPKHFEFLRAKVLPTLRRGTRLRVWSAASSSGEEAYTLAMVLAEELGLNSPWEILGSDVSTAVLQRAAAAHYPMERAAGIPTELLQRYCLKGVGAQEGTFAVGPELRNRTRFGQVNLVRPLPDLGQFDIIFLRNVLIYFQPDVKTAVVERLAERLKPGGWFFIGHSETLNGLTKRLTPVIPTVYRKDA